MRRIYLLDGKRIDPSEVMGFVHVARDDNWGHCISCLKPLLKGQKRVRMNIFGTDEPIHLDCYVKDHSKPIILGVKIEKRLLYGVMRNHVICQTFSHGA